MFHGVMLKKRQEVDGLRTSLLDLMAASNPDGKAIEATIAQINKTQEEMQKIVVAHMLEFKSMLDARPAEEVSQPDTGGHGPAGKGVPMAPDCN